MAESHIARELLSPLSLTVVPGIPDETMTGSPLASSAPTVSLLRGESTNHPFALAVAAAWSCYGAKPARIENVIKLVYDDPDPGLSEEKLVDRAKRRDRALRLYADLFAAGHHTTFQHATFVFMLDNVSRLAIWSFFHSHPHYNSEQVSQRYREVTGASMAVPKLPEQCRQIYEGAVERSIEGYRRLVSILSEDFSADYARVFPARAKAKSPEGIKRFNDAVQKRSQEVARYVLPLATGTHLYHTVNALTLLRYYVLANQPDAPGEVRFIVNRMVEEVVTADPYFLGSPEYPLDLRAVGAGESLEAQAMANWQGVQGCSEAALDAFDLALGDVHSRLVHVDPDAERLLADAVRTVLGVPAEQLADSEAIAQVLDPAKNSYLGHPLYLAMNSKLMQTLNHITFTFQKRISGAEDAQNQRHRGTQSSSPVLLAHMRKAPDVIVPWAIARNPRARAEYDATITAMWTAKNQLLELGASPEAALYLLPNSNQVRFYETGTLLTYYWKWVKRLCYDAQREIFDTAQQEVAQVREVLPGIGKYVDGPPCVMRSRAGATPICPEGERFCGIPVWRDYRFETIVDRRVM